MYKFDIKIFIVLALAAVSCTGSSDTAPGEISTAMKFAAEENSSRALVNSEEALRVQPFAVWADYMSSGSANEPAKLFDAEAVSYSDGAWGYANTQYWFPGMSYSFTAVHPASAGAAASYATATHTLTLGSFDARKGIDLLAATFTHNCSAATTNPVVAFSFSHLLSRLEFVAEVDASLGMTIIIKSATLGGVPATGVWRSSGYDAGNMNYGVWTADAAGDKMSSTAGPFSINAGGVDTVFGGDNALLVIPQEVPLDATFEIEYYEGTDASTVRKYMVDLSVVSATLAKGWQAGQTYRYRLVIGAADYIIFDMPSVSQWNYEEGGNFIVQ